MPSAHAHLDVGATCTCTIGRQRPMHIHTWAPVPLAHAHLDASSLCQCTPRRQCPMHQHVLQLHMSGWTSLKCCDHPSIRVGPHHPPQGECRPIVAKSVARCGCSRHANSHWEPGTVADGPRGWELHKTKALRNLGSPWAVGAASSAR